MTQKLYRSTTVPVEHAQVWVLVNDLGNRLHVHRIGDAPSETCILPREWLEPYTPPSIDDPAPWPLSIEDDGLALTIGDGPTDDDPAWVAGLDVIVDGKAQGLALSADELRLLARAAWQRADAWERGRTAAGGA